MLNPVILCIDDEPGNLRLLVRTLGPNGYNVMTANNGREALDIIGSRKVDLVLTDVLMPVVDGLETCRRIDTPRYHPESRFLQGCSRQIPWRQQALCRITGISH
jgi:CheY-like chemotaxis protein